MQTKRVMVGRVAVGGGAPVSVQSMLNIPAHDIAGNIAQAKRLDAAGCDILRVALTDQASVALIDAIKQEVDRPLVADIQFDYKLALESVAAGADKIRLNPGNIGGEEKIRAVARACAAKGIPIRVGANGGSLERDLLAKYGGPTARALAESAMRHVAILEAQGFGDIVVALKSSDVSVMVEAYRMIARQCDYPLHLGVTEAGTPRMGTIKSAVGIGALLLDGIGDTLRVSLTADPVEEVTAGRDILRALGRGRGVNVISCPTCGRTAIDLIALTAKVEQALAHIEAPLTVAVMGCAVNGPGEASHADLGVAGGAGEGLLFSGGKVLVKVPYAEILPRLVALAGEMAAAKENTAHKQPQA